MSKTKRFFCISLAAVSVFLTSVPVFAASQLVPCGGPGQHACTVCDFFEMCRRVTDFVIFRVIPVLAALCAAIAGAYYLWTRGNPDAMNRAKKGIEIAVGGFLFVFVGWLFLNTFFMAIGTAEFNGFSLKESWWKISAKCSIEWGSSGECGDGILQAGEACDPKMTIDACQSRYGWSEQKCKLVRDNCKPAGEAGECTSEYCGDGILQAGEECDPMQTVENCVETSGKTADECTKFVGSCTRDCKQIVVEEPEETEETSDTDLPPDVNDPYVEDRCLEIDVPTAHVPDCREVHDGLEGYTLIKKNYYVAPGSYHASALSPIEAKGANGERICMCFDTCMYAEKFKYVLVDKEKRLFDVYASEEGKRIFEMNEFGALMDDTKPVIYLYPEKEARVSVTIDPKGTMVESIPDYGKGWNITAAPDGTIDGEYGYLFYETEIPLGGLDMPIEGYLVEYGKLAEFFDEILPKVGLQGKEITDFKDWWLDGRLKPAKYYLVKLLDRQTIDAVESMTITPKPDAVIRIRFVFFPTDEKIETIPPEIATPVRNGFTAVEWGGLVEK